MHDRQSEDKRRGNGARAQAWRPVRMRPVAGRRPGGWTPLCVPAGSAGRAASRDGRALWMETSRCFPTVRSSGAPQPGRRPEVPLAKPMRAREPRLAISCLWQTWEKTRWPRLLEAPTESFIPMVRLTVGLPLLLFRLLGLLLPAAGARRGCGEPRGLLALSDPAPGARAAANGPASPV